MNYCDFFFISGSSDALSFQIVLLFCFLPAQDAL